MGDTNKLGSRDLKAKRTILFIDLLLGSILFKLIKLNRASLFLFNGNRQIGPLCDKLTPAQSNLARKDP